MGEESNPGCVYCRHYVDDIAGVVCCCPKYKRKDPLRGVVTEMRNPLLTNRRLDCPDYEYHAPILERFWSWAKAHLKVLGGAYNG